MSIPRKSREDPIDLAERMTALGVEVMDIQETITENKTNTKLFPCVILSHVPTGLKAKCQASLDKERNRFIALRLLLDKVEGQQKAYNFERRSMARFFYFLIALLLLIGAAIVLTFLKF